MIQGAKILVIDEEPIIGSSVKAGLKAVSHSVRIAQSEKEATDALGENFDLVFIDLGLPDSVCDEIVRLIRSRSEAAIVFMSSVRSDEEQCKHKADDIIYKPLNPIDLRTIVQRLLKPGKTSALIPASPRILVVDDDEIVLRSIIDILKDRFEITGTKSPLEALGLLTKKPFEIMLTDLMMEEMHGLDLIKKAMNIRASLVSIVITGYANKDVAVAALKEGVYDFLEKPFTPDIVIQSINRVWKQLRTELENRRLITELKQLNKNLQLEIEERKQAEKELAKAKEAAESASRAKSDFMGIISHELRTPMNAIIGMTDLVLMEELPPDQRKFLENVTKSANILLDIINDILEFSRMDISTTKIKSIPFYLRDIVDNSLERQIAKAHTKGLKLTCNVREDVPEVVIGDPERLRQIISKLVDNAVKFTDQGELAVHVRTKEISADTLLLRFTVKDTGIGIPTDKQTQIFEAFTQADGSSTRRFGGTGLGLSIASKLIDIMGGELWVESAPGKGSTFDFTIQFYKI
ncbi:MAG: response regulator [Desulfobacteraceae bacterium]|nr:response regulator [Desulfobacteraceae bacterium]